MGAGKSTVGVVLARRTGCEFTDVDAAIEHGITLFDTADIYGNRGGYICKFNPRTGLMEQMSKEGCRLKSREGAVNNFNEWVKFSRYAEKFL